MESKDTYESQQETDAYIEDDFNYYRPNIKKDAGSAKFRRLKDWQIDLATEVPAEPHEKHDKPNDSHYEKELKKINDKIEEHKKNKLKLLDDIKKEKFGNRPELNDLHTTLKDLNEKLKPIEDDIKTKSETIKAPLEKEKLYKEKKDRLEKEIDIKNVEKLTAQIKYYQEQLGFATLSVTEEKKMMQMKLRLESQVESTKIYCKARDTLKKLRDENKSTFDELKVLKDQKFKILEEKKLIKAKIEGTKKVEVDNKEVVTQLQAQVDSIKNEIKNLNEQYRNLEQEWNTKWIKFEEYQSIMDYINNIKKIQQEIIKKEEKQKRKEEKDAKKNQKVEVIEMTVVHSEDSKETITCKNLIDYFKNLLPKTETSNATTEKNGVSTISDKLAQDLKKGNLVTLNRDALNSTQVLGVEGGAKKKKDKVVKKKEEKTTEYLILDVGILGQIRDFNLAVPNKKSEVEAFVKTLEGKLVELKENVLKVRNQPKKESEENQA